MAILEVKGIYKKFGKTEVLRGIDFSMEEGEVLSIIGSSGSGKTTLLRSISFLEKADLGTITLDGEIVFDAESEVKKALLNSVQSSQNLVSCFSRLTFFPSTQLWKM